MRTRRSRFPVTLLVLLLWLVAGTRPMAVAWHVAEDHAPHDHPAPRAAGETIAHAHGAGHGNHGHGLVETLPGVRNDTRVGVNALPMPAGLLPLLPEDGIRTGIRRSLATAPGVPPPEAPSVLRL